MNKDKKTIILSGMRDGFPIGLGYFAVSFSLGIIAGKAGLNAIEGFISSLFTRASAGEYGGYSVILADASYYEMILICMITNLRYLLMNTALSQKFSASTSLIKRILVAACCTDEIFGISIAYEGDIAPSYVYAATAVAGPMWATGTALGIVAGNVLSTKLVSALSVALYGMFIAIIIPVGKKDKAVLVAIIISFLLSYACSYMPYISQISSGMRTIILTIVIAAVAAIIHPVAETEDAEVENE